MILSLRRVWLAALALSFALPATAQTVVKYGADFLAAGVGARALGMGGAYVAHADDVTAGYWNVAGLNGVGSPEVAYMHAERFDGAVSFDYAAGVYPLSDRSTVGVTFVRSAVDDIANTLDAYDPATGQINPDDVTLFSAADNALFLSYARGIGETLSVGASAKIIQRGVGDFASAWGYSLDLGAQVELGRVRLGLTVQDATGMVQSWSVDAERFAGVDSVSRPVGLTELVLPVARLGASTQIPMSQDVGLTVAADLDLAFDGQETYVLDAGGVSFRPRLGAELAFRDLLAFRAGLSDVTTSDRFGTQITPSVGAGVHLGPLAIDYGFGDFGGVTSELGFSHRVSLAYRFGASPH